MSSQKGNDKKKKSQKYQNKKAFQIQFNEKAEEISKKAPLDRLCKRCHEQIEWKIRFQKYKPATTVSKCSKCDEKRIYKAYRNCCDICSDKYEICTKCLAAKELQSTEKEPEGVDKKLLEKMELYMKTLRERSRRKILRLINKNLITWGGEYFVYQENEKPVDNIKFKQAEKDDDFEDLDDDDDEGGDEDDDDDDEEDDLDDEEEEESKKNKGKGKEGQKPPQSKEKKPQGNPNSVPGKPEQTKDKGVPKKANTADNDEEDDDLDDDDDDDNDEGYDEDDVEEEAADKIKIKKNSKSQANGKPLKSSC